MASRQTKDEAKIKELEQQIAANQEANDEFVLVAGTGTWV
jgi:hypothetical protein